MLWWSLLKYWRSQQPIFVFEGPSNGDYWYGQIKSVGLDHLVLRTSNDEVPLSHYDVHIPFSKVNSVREWYQPGAVWILEKILNTKESQ